MQITSPDFIARTPRPLKYRQFYKASEIRDLLLVYFPILLKDILPQIYYEHFLHLFYGVRILLQTKIHANEIDLAEYLLKSFSEKMESLYGRERCSFNVHQLNHMADSVRRWGPLWCWSMFIFEDGNGYYKKVNHGPNKIDVEIMNTVKMVNAFYILREKIVMINNQIFPDKKVLDISKQIKINLNEKDALEELINSNQIFVRDNILSVYTRVNVNKQV